MKLFAKVLSVIILSISVSSCGNGSGSGTDKKDSAVTMPPKDTAKKIMVIDSATHEIVDSMKK